ncbi:MAG: hypothetical protein LBT08_10005, partial [Synergistaceae bacterium]|nr:hypothetical protein [Synergistaceae bacterium]
LHILVLQNTSLVAVEDVDTANQDTNAISRAKLLFFERTVHRQECVAHSNFEFKAVAAKRHF